MSERIYATRSGGRTVEPRSAATSRRIERPGRGSGREPGVAAGDARGARHATDDTRGSGTRRDQGDPVAQRGRGSDAPVDGTAALRTDPAVSEPLRVTAAATAPRLQVAPPAPISAPRAPFVAGVIGLVIVGVLGILLINTKTNENSFRIDDLRKQGSALDNQQQDLQNQLVEVSSVGNLDAAARRLGLVKADRPALIRLPDGKVIGTPTPPDGKLAVTAQDAKTDQGEAATSETDKGAANIVPNGVTAPGLTPNGTATAGPAGLGTAPNGTAGNGTAGNGTAGNGTTATGTGR